MASDWMIQRMNARRTRTGSAPLVPTQAQSQVQLQKPTPTPYQQIATGARNVVQAPLRMAAAGLGKIGGLLAKPSEWIENKLTSGKGYEDWMSKIPSMPTAKIGVTPEMEKRLSPIRSEGGALAMRMTLDPLNLFGVSAVRKPFGALAKGLGTKITPKILPKIEQFRQFAKTKPSIYKPIEATVSPYFRSPGAGKIIEATKEATGLKLNKLYGQVSEASKGLSPATQARIGQLLEGGVSVSPKEERLRRIASEFRKLGEQLGKEMVDEGLLKPAQYKKYKGTYMHHMWESATKGTDPFAKIADIPTIDTSVTKFRKGRPGYIKEFAAPTFKGLGTEIKNVEAARMYKELARQFGEKAPITAGKATELAGKGYKYVDELSKARGGEILKKTVFPQEIIDYIGKNKTIQGGDLVKLYDKALRGWKAGKTIYNPAYHVRNLVSNQILTEMQTGKGLPRTLVSYVKSVRRYMGKGSQEFVKEAVDSGLIKKKNFGEAFEEFLNVGFKKEGKIRSFLNKPAHFQQFSEDTAKLNVFTSFRKDGLSVAEAVKKAEEAIFSPYRLAMGEKRVLGSLFPFYSFTRQAAPFFAKTLLKHPERLTKYPKMERAVEKLTAGEAPDEKNLPDWMKKMVRVPSKTKAGLQEYLNTQYFYPWGSFLEEGTSLPSSTLGLGLNPVLEEYAAQKSGIDPYFKSEFVKPGQPASEQMKARLGHAATTFMPSLYRSIVNKIIPAAQGRKDYVGRERDLGKTLFGELSGLKLYPYDTKQAAKSKGYERYMIEEDYTAERKRILKDQSLTPEERKKKLQQITQRRSERIAELK